MNLLQTLRQGCHRPAPSRHAPAPALREIHYVMGTLLDITLLDRADAEGKRVLRTCFQEARRLEEIFSAHDGSSDLSRLNRRAGLGPIDIDQELSSILNSSLQLARRTDGALDVTIGPLLDLWRTAENDGARPSSALVTETLRRTGMAKLHLLPDGKGELRESGMRLDLGGIGKGYAVDCLKALLVREGVERAFINFGRSSLVAIGFPPGLGAWPVLLEADDGGPIGGARLKDQALSVSSSFGHSYVIGETRYGHLIDPRDGYPLPHSTCGVAVAQTATEAEALTKALVILGAEQGLSVVERFPRAEGFLVHSNGSRIGTSGFTEAVGFQVEQPTRRGDLA